MKKNKGFAERNEKEKSHPQIDQLFALIAETQH